MLWNNLQNLQVLHSHLYVTHLATHAETLEYTSRIRTCTNGTWLTQTVVLTVSALAYTTEAMTLYNALETMTLRDADNIYELNIREQIYSNLLSEFVLLVVTLKLGKVLHWSDTSLLEVTHNRLRNVLFSRFLEADLYSFITILLDRLDLSHNTRTYFNYSAWHVLAISTEDGSHSDFFA